MTTCRTAACIAALCLGCATVACRSGRTPGRMPFWSPDGGRAATIVTHVDPSPGAPAPLADPRIIAHWGGRAAGLVIDGAHAYFGHGMRLAVADVSSPMEPRLVTESDVMARAVEDVVLADGLIVARVGNGVQLIDIAVAARPALRGRFAITDTLVSVAAIGRTAYLLAERGSVHVVDLGDADAPVEIARIDALGWSSEVAAHDATVFVAGEALTAVDVRDPARPRVVGRAPIQGTQVTVDGERAYLVGTDGIVDAVWRRIVDVHNPKRMRLVHQEATGLGDEMLIHHGRIFTNGSDPWGACCRIQELGIGDPPELDLLGGVQLPTGGLEVEPLRDFPVSSGGPYEMAIAGETLHVLSEHGGLHLLDLGAPFSPVEMSALPIASFVSDVAVAGGVAYAITGLSDGGADSVERRFVDTFDLAAADPPPPLGRLAHAGFAGRIALDGGRLYLRGGNELTILDASDPAHLRVLGSYVSGGAIPGEGAPLNVTTEVAVRGGDAWLTERTYHRRDASNNLVAKGAIEHVDAADPAQPRRIERIELGTPPVDLAWDGDHLYVAEQPQHYAGPDEKPGVRIYDVGGASGSAAREVVHLGLPRPVHDIEVSGGRLHLLLKDELRIFDHTPPELPTERGALPLDTDAYYEHLAVDGTTAYLGRGYKRSMILVVDVSDPDHPRVVEAIDDLPGQLVGMTVAEEGLVVALRGGGVVVIRRRLTASDESAQGSW